MCRRLLLNMSPLRGAAPPGGAGEGGARNILYTATFGHKWLEKVRDGGLDQKAGERGEGVNTHTESFDP